jgi:hypothetical protein
MLVDHEDAVAIGGETPLDQALRGRMEGLLSDATSATWPATVHSLFTIRIILIIRPVGITGRYYSLTASSYKRFSPPILQCWVFSVIVDGASPNFPKIPQIQDFRFFDRLLRLLWR